LVQKSDILINHPQLFVVLRANLIFLAPRFQPAWPR